MKLRRIVLCTSIAVAAVGAMTLHTQAQQEPDSAAQSLTPPVAQFRDANHRLCSEPQQGDRRMRGMCFLFRQQGDEVIGQYFEPYTEKSICVHGVVNRNLVSGFARGVIFSESPDLSVSERLQGNELANWDPQSDYLDVARGRVVESLGESQIAGYSGIAAYDIALLDLNTFYRYNAGTVLPPQDCAIAQTNNSEAQIPEPSQVAYEQYVNERFDYRVLYPDTILTPQDPPANGDGRTFQSPDGQIVMRVYGYNNALSKSLDQLYQQVLDEHSNSENQTITYQLIGDNFFAVSGYQGDWVFYQKTILDDNVVKTLEFSYRRSFQPDFDPIVSEVATSFETLSSSAGSE